MKKLLLFASLLIIYACQEAKDPKLEEAAKVHNEASAIAEEIEAQIEATDSLQNVLTEKKKTQIDAAAIAKIDSISASLGAVAQAFKDWEANIIEVPGMEHNHAEGEHHHHDHKPAPNVTPEQMLDLQKEMKANIEKIKVDFEKVKKNIATF